MKLLMVCLGNICRSPMAEGALRARLDASRLAGRVQVDSCGTGDWHEGEPPDQRAIACARGHGVDISGLRARPLQPSDYTSFDVLLCADVQNLKDVRRRAPPGATSQTALLMEWAGQAPGTAVPDPYTGNSGHFEEVWRLVDSAAQAVVEKLLKDGP
ncbi:MAG: low molecular weight protein-tyrosine-phosphatase [Pseudoxanthomonas sp.]